MTTNLYRFAIYSVTCSILAFLSSGCTAVSSKVSATPSLTANGRYCLDHTSDHHARQAPDAPSVLGQELGELKELIAKSLLYRQEMIRLVNRLKEKVDAGQPLSGEDLDNLNLGTQAQLQLREKLYAIAEQHECWLDDPGSADASIKLPADDRLAGVLISLSAGLTLYDNYLLGISAVRSEQKLRRHINQADAGYNKKSSELDKITANFNSIWTRQRIRKALVFYEKEKSRLRETASKDQGIAFLNGYVSASPSYALVRKYAPLAVLVKEVDFAGTVTADTISRLDDEGVNLFFGMLLGNASDSDSDSAGAKHGLLFNNPAMTARVREQLRPGDILVDKTRFSVTDKLIPGFWGHAAIWTGTERELKELGIWDDPVVRPHQQKIREGHQVVEALRPGVAMNSLEHFMNVDDLGVFRQRGIDDSERKAVIIRALRQVGKGYDFNFNVEATDRVICSGLVYLAYTNIPWESKRILNRVIFSPDNVAEKALPGGPLELVLLVHKGEWVANDPLRELTSLMRQ